MVVWYSGGRVRVGSTEISWAKSTSVALRCGAGIVLALLALLCSSAKAWALELSWDAPSGCPRAEEVEAAVARLAEGRPLDTAPASVKLVQLGAERWSAKLTWGTATRTLYGESCRSVTQAVVVILAMALEPESEAAAVEETSPAVSQAEVPRDGVSRDGVPQGEVSERRASPDRALLDETSPDETSPDETSPRRGTSREGAARDTGFAWGASLRTLGEYGILPGPAWGGSVTMRGGLGDRFGEMAVLGLLPREAVLPERPNQGGRFHWVGVRLAGCTELGSRAMLFACAGFELGQVTGRGFGVRNPRVGSGPWLAPGLQGLLKLPLGRRWHFEAMLGGFVALVRPEFELDDQGVVHQSGPVSVRLELGLGWN